MAIWPGKGGTKKFAVKLKNLKIEGLPSIEDEKQVKMAVEVNWEGPIKSGFPYLSKKSNQVQSFSSKEIQILNFNEIIEWDNEFDCVWSFSMNSKNPTSFAPWVVSFNILYGEIEEQQSSSSSSSPPSIKMQVIGKVKLDLGGLASKAEVQIDQKLPISLKLNEVSMESSLHVVVNFLEMRNTSHSRTLSDSFEVIQKSSDPSILLTRSNSQGAVLANEKTKKKKLSLFGKQFSLKHFGDSSSAATSNSESEYVVVASSSKNGESNSVTESQSSLSSETQLDMAEKGGFWKWKRRRSFKKPAEKPESNLDAKKPDNPSSWETRELVSRDGNTRVNADVFFASFDQRSDKAAGVSACAAIVAIIAHWLQLNPVMTLTGDEFDQLITEGSSEWRRLCNDESNKGDCPDNHFDLDTILNAELRPLVVLPNNSRYGFFHPEEFDHLKDAASFDEIWKEINTDVNEMEPRVYIVRWNEHFFILKVEANANYIIDSLGERLYEGCNQAYVLKFDDSTVMYEKNKVQKEKNEEKDKKEDKKEKDKKEKDKKKDEKKDKKEKENEEKKEKKEEEKEEKKDKKEEDEEEKGEDKVICRGKECCKEYMKRFLAAIPLRELKDEEAKGKTIDVLTLYERLQIDFHLSSHNSAVSTANTSITPSPETDNDSISVDDDEYVQV